MATRRTTFPFYTSKKNAKQNNNKDLVSSSDVLIVYLTTCLLVNHFAIQIGIGKLPPERCFYHYYPHHHTNPFPAPFVLPLGSARPFLLGLSRPTPFPAPPHPGPRPPSPSLGHPPWTEVVCFQFVALLTILSYVQRPRHMGGIRYE